MRNNLTHNNRFKTILVSCARIYFLLCAFVLIPLLSYVVLFARSNDLLIIKIALSILAIFSCIYYFFIKTIERRVNYFFVHFSVIVSIFLLNLSVEIIRIVSTETRVEMFQSEGGSWDGRTRKQFILDLQKEIGADNVFRHSNPGALILSNILNKIKLGHEFYPLTNISKSTIVHCNESGIWRYFETDHHGFNNPIPNFYDGGKKSLILLGDSFTEGFCVDVGHDIGNKLRGQNFNVMNLGKAGGGVLLAKAILREYRYKDDFHPDFIVYFLFTSNDLNDTNNEYNNEVFQSYLSNDHFSQNLVNRQDEVDKFWKEFFSLTSTEKFLRQYPEITKYLQAVPVKSGNYWKHLKNIGNLYNLRRYARNLARLESEKVIKKARIEVLKRSLRSLDSEVNEVYNKPKLIVVLLPSFTEIVDNKLGYDDEVVDALNELDIDYISMTEEFKSQDFKRFFDYGLPGHYNSEGYHYLAGVVAKYIATVSFSGQIKKTE
jgi:hypothetical protein